MQFSLIEIFQHMGVPAMVVAGVLLVFGLASLTVFVERILTLRRSRAESRSFAGEAAGDLQQVNVEAVIAYADKHKRGHLPRVVRAGLTTFRHAQQTSDVAGLPPVERTRRFLERFMEEIGGDLRRGLSLLATVGSVAPFVGLLGTVLGIITAFQGIASSGSGGLSSVAAGISEALIETALGLAVAIPAVLAFNYLSGVITQEELVLNHSAGELLDRIEDWAERRAQTGEPTAAALPRGDGGKDHKTSVPRVAPLRPSTSEAMA
jgi:biopolymer transport protein ExbB